MSILFAGVWAKHNQNGLYYYGFATDLTGVNSTAVVTFGDKSSRKVSLASVFAFDLLSDDKKGQNHFTDNGYSRSRNEPKFQEL